MTATYKAELPVKYGGMSLQNRRLSGAEREARSARTKEKEKEKSHGLFLGFISFLLVLSPSTLARHSFSCFALVYRSHHLHRALPNLPAGYSGNNRMCQCQSKFERKRSADLTVRPEIKYSRTEHFLALLVPLITILNHQATEHISKNGHNSHSR